MLKIDDITMRFGGVLAVNGFSTEIKKDEIVGLIGPNGAGKTTVFNMVTGVYKPNVGKRYPSGRPRPEEDRSRGNR